MYCILKYFFIHFKYAVDYTLRNITETIVTFAINVKMKKYSNLDRDTTTYCEHKFSETLVQLL
jgi:hypothetical protein